MAELSIKTAINDHPSTPQAEADDRRTAYASICALAFSLVLALILASPGYALTLGYSGRLADASGAPLDGPLDIDVRFFGSATGSDQLGSLPTYREIRLADGIFQLELDLDSSLIQQVFGDGTRTVFIEVAAAGRTYPRQRFLAVPYALRVPIDGSTLTFDSDGRLKVRSVSQAQVTDLGTSLAAKADMSYVNTQVATRAPSNATLSGDVSGSLGGSITVDRLKNFPLPGSIGAGDTNKYLQFNGTNFVLASVSSTSGGTVTSVTASDPLSVTNGSSAPALSITKSSSTVDGYLSAADFGTFNAKQDKIDGTTDLATASLTTREVRFWELPVGGSEYVGFKAPDTIATPRIWTLPSGDGSAGTVLATDGSGHLSWVPQVTVPVTTVAGRTGAISLTTVDVAEGAHLYYTQERARLAVSATAPLTYNSTSGLLAIGAATSVTDGYLSKEDFIAFNGKQAALGYAPLNKSGDTMTGNLNLGTHRITGLGAPTDGTDGATKDYVDTGLSSKVSSSALGSLATKSTVSGADIADGSISDIQIADDAAISDSKLAPITTPGKVSASAISGGTITATIAGTATNVTGVVAIANGGTGASSLAANSVLLGNGVAALQAVAPGAGGNILTSNGTTWTSAPIPWGSPGPIGTGTPQTGAFTSVTTQAQVGLELRPFGSVAGDTGEIRFKARTSANHVGFKAPDAVESSRVWVLPIADGTSGQVLKTDGSGHLSWVTGASGDMQKSENLAGLGNPATARDNLGLGPLATASTIVNGNISDTAAIATSKLSGALTSVVGHGLGALATKGSVESGDITNGTIMNEDISASAAIADTKLAPITSAGRVSGGAITGGTIGGSATFGGSGGVNTDGAITAGGSITANGANEVRFGDSDSSHYVGFKSPGTVSANVTWTLPPTDGAPGQVLSTDGSGALTWATNAGGGGGGGSAGGLVTLTDAPTVAVDASLGTMFQVTLGGNRTLAAATNQTPGAIYIFKFAQDSVGARTLTFDPGYVFPAAITAPAISSGPNTVALGQFVSDGTNLYYLAGWLSTSVAAPAQVTATGQSASYISLAWVDTNPNEQGYRIEVSTDGSSWSSLSNPAAGATSYAHYSLLDGTRYDYRIQTVGATGNSQPIYAYAFTRLLAPSAFAVDPISASRIDLTWVDSTTRETGYVVERRLTGTTEWSVIATLGANTVSYSDTGLPEKTRYDYRVQAYNAGTTSAYTSAIYGTTAPTNGICGDSAANNCYLYDNMPINYTLSTPLGKNLIMVYANGTSGFKVWKENGGTKILRANGLDEWTKQLNLNGRGLSATNFADGGLGTANTVLAGRACPPNVFIDTSNMTSTGNCLYYSPGYAAQALNAAGTSQTTAGSIGLGNWDVSETGNGTGSSWYEGNIQTCANKGMRLPTLYETTAASPSSYKPADPELTWAATATGVPHSGGNWTWTSSAYTSNTSYYLIWYGTTSSYYNYDYAYHAVRCVVP